MSEIVQRFARVALAQPEQPVIHVSDSSGVITASGLWHAHLELRRQLLAIGVGPDQLVLSAAGNRPAGIPLLLACLALRAPLMPVDADATITEIAEFAERFGASAVVLPERSVRSYGERSTSLVDDLHVVRHPADRTPSGGGAILKLTSGSTGFPKAILTTEAQLDGRRGADHRRDGNTCHRHSDCCDSAVALLRIRQSRHATAPSRHRSSPARVVRSSAGAAGRAQVPDACLSRCPLHVQLLHRQSSGGGLAILPATVDLGRSAPGSANRGGISRPVRHRDPFVLWNKRDRWHCLRCQQRREP